ncbi:hypothetical protein DERF_001308 [Dermatophagoides farinae]|uniref:Uncharacterized protein n=1 Tax=Dermatophagoides farinae TaxID=6954 RepID=A0A922IAL4_DERFA|nr:uncharacterized protein LOC124491451 [Dermatophagoides farinae]KAH7641468.1 hypothetical protein HUG17_4512 [Dermatophagoides farinae]KAH9527282.1 hypothetical protein DERF_001308 [Dermatophagoides farinae]
MDDHRCLHGRNSTIEFVLLFLIIIIIITTNQIDLAIATNNDQSTTTPTTFINSLIARFQSNGIRGYVLFTENGTSTSISTKIFDNGSNNETYSWKVYNAGYMIDNNDCNVRNNIYLSFDLTLLMGSIEPIRQNIFNVHLNFVTGEHSFLGKTLVLKGNDSGRMSCAIILPFENKSTFIAYFRTNIHGIVYFLQSGNLFSIVSSLHHLSPLIKTSLYDWNIVSMIDNHRSTLKTTMKNDEKNFDSYYKNEIQSCNSSMDNLQPLLQSMETNQISVSSESSTLNSRSYINLLNVPNLTSSSSSSSSTNLYIILRNNNQNIACAPIHQLYPRKTVAKFNEPDYLIGQVMFSQESPIDPTLVDIELKTNKYGYSYGIDELPSISRAAEAHKTCPNINNIIYNPTNISPFSVPIEGLGTSDQYAIGDLSGKYGTLLQKSDEKISTVDFNLPLFGPESVVGRALVFYAPNGTTVACANLELVDVDMTVSFATFDKPIQGQIIFKQPKNRCNEDTSIYFEISRSNDNDTITHNHEWNIHRSPIFTDNSWSTSDCSKTDEIFNPYNKTMDTIYRRDCNGKNLIACIIGDMSKKLSTIEIVPYKINENGDVNLKKYYFIDIHLPLCGPNSIIGKSIQINKNNFDQQSLACTNIVLFESDDDQDYS